jgi:hypothetical protein
MFEGCSYGYPSVYSPVIDWVRRMFNSGYNINDIKPQLEYIIKYTDNLNIDECLIYVEDCWREEYRYNYNFKQESWCDGWTKDKWDAYHRHMKLQGLGI